ncbi:MAG TPA: hypothetical protein VFS51_02075 [Gemmatimonadales bacterium]|nr:hypothetical protein [Gemmatimonadales bacterium]
MRGSWFLVSLMAVTACSSDRTDPGIPPDVPAELTSTTLDGAIALFWTDNSFTSDPSNFSNYRIYSTSYDLVADLCGSSWGLEGTTVAAEFVAGALANGTTRCFAVSAVSLDGAESARSQVRLDTPRPDSRNVALFARQVQDEESGFRFWLDSDGDGRAEDNELGIVGLGSSLSIDFSVERDGTGTLFLTPVRAGTGVEFYDADTPVEDLTSIDFAADVTYLTTPIEAAPGFGYVFEMDGGDGLARYGAVRVTHVGETFLILDWAFQTDPGNPELLVVKKTSVN